MDLKLQQAIVATRAGRTDVAQHLLTQLIHEKPDNAHAWFLLGHIVDSKDRQVRYLQKAVALDPKNTMAKSQIDKLTAPPVPAPVFAKEEPQKEVSETKTRAKTADPDPIPAAAAKTPTTEPEVQKTPEKLPEWLQDLENKALDTQQTPGTKGEDWPVPARTPKREHQDRGQKARILHIPQDASQAKTSSDRTSEEVWLLRILAVMVILAALVLGFLVLLILF
jgi:hypothetical protein